MPDEMLMGCETEFGIAGGWTRCRAARVFFGAVARRLVLCGDGACDVFLANGARCYVDHGRHNEYCTPECCDPLQLVACDLAGRRIMVRGARKARVRLLLTNFDYATGATWGTHENYQCRRRLGEEFGLRLDMHLVTRLVFSGAGGPDPSRAWVQPVLSPRACATRVRRAASPHSPRGLVCDKLQHYGAGWRLHVTAGESLRSRLASYLKFATTAMVVWLLDRGIAVGPGLPAASPVDILHRVNQDLGLTGRIGLADGRRLTALEIQWCLLEDVAGNLKHLPNWAPRAVELWADTLDDLGDPATRARLPFDWTLYLRLLQEVAAADGLDWRTNCAPEWRARACELYVQLRTLGGDSLFRKVVVRDQIRHRLPDLTKSRIHHAIDHPPPGRASCRGELIRSLGHRGAVPDGDVAIRASWDRLHHGDKVLRIPETEIPALAPVWVRGPAAGC